MVKQINKNNSDNILFICNDCTYTFYEKDLILKLNKKHCKNCNSSNLSKLK